MTLAPLATVDDLTRRGIPVTDVDFIDIALDAASAAVRDAAGSPISAIATTVAVEGGRGSWLGLPDMVSEVESVQINGVDVEGYKIRGGRLWRDHGWYPGRGNDILVTATFGSYDVDEDVVDLICSLVAAALAEKAKEEPYNPERGLTSEAIDDYRRGYAKGDDEIVNVYQLPRSTRDWLHERYAGQTFVVGSA